MHYCRVQYLMELTVNLLRFRGTTLDVGQFSKRLKDLNSKWKSYTIQIQARKKCVNYRSSGWNRTYPLRCRCFSGISIALEVKTLLRFRELNV